MFKYLCIFRGVYILEILLTRLFAAACLCRHCGCGWSVASPMRLKGDRPPSTFKRSQIIISTTRARFFRASRLSFASMRGVSAGSDGAGAATASTPQFARADTLRALQIPPTERQLGPSVQHFNILRDGLLSECLMEVLALPQVQLAGPRLLYSMKKIKFSILISCTFAGKIQHAAIPIISSLGRPK